MVDQQGVASLAMSPSSPANVHSADSNLKNTSSTDDFVQDYSHTGVEPVTVPEVAQNGGPDAQVPTAMSGSKVPGEESSPHGLSDQTNFLPTRQVITVFCGLSFALACAFLDQTIVATALPAISSDLHAGKSSSWVATAYLLTSLAFTPLYGRWSDVFGRKQVLVASLAIFFVFSLACALAKTMIQLIVFRALQGIGGGGLITLVLIIVSDIVSLKDRGKFQGINEAIIAVSNGVGPILGGVFSEYTTWRWAFWINLPLGALAIVVAIWLLPLKGVKGNMREKLLRIDYVGSALTIISSIGMLLGLNWGGVTYPWASAAVLVPLILGAAIFVLFMSWEAKAAKLPIIPIHIFKYRTVVGVYIATAMNGMTFFTIMYFIPQFLQLVRGTSPVNSSLLLLPFLAPVAVFVFIAGQISSRTGHYRYLIIGGYALWTVAQGLQTTIDRHSSTGKIIGVLLIGGVSSGFTFQTSLLAAQAAVPRHEMAVVTGVRNFVRLWGSTLALAIAGSIVNNILRSTLRDLALPADQVSTLLDDPTAINSDVLRSVLTETQRITIIDGYTRGFHAVFYMTVACQLIAFLSAVFLIGQHELMRADDKEIKARSKEMLRARKAARRAEKDTDVEAATPSNEKGAGNTGLSTNA